MTTIGLIGSGHIGSTVARLAIDEKGTPARTDVIRAAIEAATR
jgi:predicted dinucleotide-binding enzyme